MGHGRKPSFPVGAPGFEPGTSCPPRLIRALARGQGRWLEVAWLSRSDAAGRRRGVFLREPVRERMGTDWARSRLSSLKLLGPATEDEMVVVFLCAEFDSPVHQHHFPQYSVSRGRIRA